MPLNLGQGLLHVADDCFIPLPHGGTEKRCIAPQRGGMLNRLASPRHLSFMAILLLRCPDYRPKQSQACLSGQVALNCPYSQQLCNQLPCVYSQNS